jgi:hypothetical protein
MYSRRSHNIGSVTVESMGYIHTINVFMWQCMSLWRSCKHTAPTAVWPVYPTWTLVSFLISLRSQFCKLVMILTPGIYANDINVFPQPGKFGLNVHTLPNTTWLLSLIMQVSYVCTLSYKFTSSVVSHHVHSYCKCYHYTLIQWDTVYKNVIMHTCTEHTYTYTYVHINTCIRTCVLIARVPR